MRDCWLTRWTWTPSKRGWREYSPMTDCDKSCLEGGWRELGSSRGSEQPARQWRRTEELWQTEGASETGQVPVSSNHNPPCCGYSSHQCWLHRGMVAALRSPVGAGSR